MNEKLFAGLTEEQKEKLKACRSFEEFQALLKREKIELNDEQAAAISGGGCEDVLLCPGNGCYA